MPGARVRLTSFPARRRPAAQAGLQHLAGGGDQGQAGTLEFVVVHQELAGHVEAVQVGGQILEVVGDQVGGQVAGGVGDGFREFGDAAQQRQFLGMLQAPAIGLGQVGFGAAPGVQHAAYPGVGVLDVIDRVVVALGLGQVQVEIQVLVGLAQHVEEAGGVVAHLGAQVAQGDVLAGAGGHGGLLAVAVEHGELDQGHGQALRIDAGGGQSALHPGDVAVVVGAPDVDDAVEAPLELVQVVGDVGGEVGVDAVVAPHHPVLLVAEGGGAEPQGAVLFVEVAVLAQLFHGLVDEAGFMQGLLGEPACRR
jgi:hypothetical protein